MWQGTFVFMVLLSKFAFWVNLPPSQGGQGGGQSFLVGVKGRQWSNISHRKLTISIWVGSDLVEPPKDLLLSTKMWCFLIYRVILLIFYFFSERNCQLLLKLVVKLTSRCLVFSWCCLRFQKRLVQLLNFFKNLTSPKNCCS